MDFTFNIDRGSYAETQFDDCQSTQPTLITERHSPTFLSIPKMGQDVIYKYNNANESALIRLTQLLVNTKLINVDDISHNPSLQEAINHAIGRYFNVVEDQSNLFQLRFQFATIATNSCEYIEHDLERFDPDNAMYFLVEHQDDNVPWITIGQSLDALEQAHEGLGQTIWHMITQASYRIPNLMSLHFAFQVCEYELGISEEHLSEEYDKETRQSAKRLRKSYLKHSPAWMSEPQEVISKEQLQSLLEKGLPGDLSNLIQLALTMQDHFIEQCELGFSYQFEIDHKRFLAVIRHNDKDSMERIVDDLEQYINSGLEYVDYLHLEIISLKDEADFLMWLSKKRDAYQLMVSVGNLLSAMNSTTGETPC